MSIVTKLIMAPETLEPHELQPAIAHRLNVAHAYAGTDTKTTHENLYRAGDLLRRLEAERVRLTNELHRISSRP